MFFLDHIWLIPLLPAFGAAVMFFFGRRLQKATVSAVCVGTIVLAFLMACGAVWQYTGWAAANNHKPYEKIIYTWLGSDTGHLNFQKSDGTPASLQADAGFLLDPLSGIWLLFVTGVGMLIHIYSTGYMAHEGGYYRFFGYLNLFMFYMLTLILANNYVLMFVGWEGVGLCSYLLIGFYFHRKSATDAGNKAFIVNRIGDAGFLLGMFTIAWYFGTLRLTEITHMARSGHFAIGDPIITAATLLLFVGACGKSAQLPLYVWLPDAMEGPTPVSALIHAATMVTAGVYMVARSHVIFLNAPFAMQVVAFVGCITALFAATIGLVQTDIKKVLAYYTVSQLGYMFMACGVGAFSAGVFHLMTHAFFKGLLFLAAGSVIHAMGGEQDMRKMGGLRKKIPWTFWTMFMGTLAIAGIPGFSGFFSKDEILLATQRANTPLWILGVLTAGLTSFYMFRLLFLTFFGEQRFDEHHVHVHESPRSMVIPLVVLAILAVGGGWMAAPLLWGKANYFAEYLSPVFTANQEAPAAAAESAGGAGLLQALLGAPVIAGLVGLFLAWWFYIRSPETPRKLAASLAALYKLLSGKYFIDELYAAVIVRPLVWISDRILWHVVDEGVIDGTVNGVARVSRESGDRLRHASTGNIRTYAAWILIGVVVFTSLLLWMVS